MKRIVMILKKGGKNMWEKIKIWWSKYFSHHYAIKRAEIVYWFIYKDGEKCMKKMSGQTEILVSSPLRKVPLFEKSISNAKLLRGVFAFYYLKKFREKYKGKYIIELIKKNDLLFLTDITGISGN